MVVQTAHSIINLPIREGAIGGSIPLLILDPGEVSIFALAWERSLSLEKGASPSKQFKAIRALGSFFDFHIYTNNGRTLSPDGLRQLLKRYYEARQYGSNEMGWNPVLKSTAKEELNYISEFSNWCCDNFGHHSANPRETVLVSSLNLPEQITFLSQTEGRKNWDKLFHLNPSTQRGKGKVKKFSFNPPSKSRRKNGGEIKYFPPSKVMQLIKECAKHSARDALYLLLIFFGSLRASEPLHLFVRDVSLLANGTAHVIVGHPQEGVFKWTNDLGHRIQGIRARFLRDRYDLGPRNLLHEQHPLHAGFKGMALDSGNETEVFWVRPDAAIMFAQLHIRYMRETRAHIGDEHPYYFVNERLGPHFGKPATLSNMTKRFDAAAHRIGLSTSEDGVNVHGGRHFFGFYCANVLQLSIESTMRFMHHESVLSTQVYYAITKERARDELRKAHERAKNDFPPKLANDILLLDLELT